MGSTRNLRNPEVARFADGTIGTGAFSIGTGAFSIGRVPRIEFGSGRIDMLPGIVARHGGHALLVTGRHSFRASERWPRLRLGLEREGIAFEELSVSGEPSPALIDDSVRRFREANLDVVVGIGGGSVLDTAKAVAGLLRNGNSVLDHLEGVGAGLPYRGPAVPFVAVPTTAGTGSEATRNAVLSVPGGYKKSFRDEQLVAQEAVVDPDLLATCPPELIAADGMDALTQLLESFVSSRANPFTDALALSGLEAARDGLRFWYESVAADGARSTADGTSAMGVASSPSGVTPSPSSRGFRRDGVADDAVSTGAVADDAIASARARMAYAALCSGITLAQAGLGAAHGLASPLGAFFPIPHGAACGAVLVEATRANLAALRERDPRSAALVRYAIAGRLLAGDASLDDREARAALVQVLAGWTAELHIAGLARFGLRDADVARVVAESRGSSMRTNPVVLTDDEIAGIVRSSM